MSAFLAKYKWGLILLIGLGLIIGTALFLRGTYKAGEKSGTANVIKEVQGETIKKTDEARKDKVEADEKVRTKPIDSVIDGLQ